MQMYPLKFKAIFKERIWGGQKLKEVFGKELPAEKRIGESWELADLPEDKTEIINGPLAGETIASAITKFGIAITGQADYQPPFPLLLKFLDSHDKLSVQVHPDQQTCRRLGSGDPKTECWYIIDAVEGAVIYKGLKPGVTRQSLAEAIKAGTVEELLETVAVKPGECHLLPAGTAHACGAGLVVFEIQTPSDTTYRIFDWNRVDEAGKGRDLHIEQALESIHFDLSSDELTVKTEGRLVDCEYFKVDKYCQAKDSETPLQMSKMRTISILAGSGTIQAGDGFSVEFKIGDTLLIPASYEGMMRSADEVQYLVTTV